MKDKLRLVEQRFEGLAAELADPVVLADRARYEAAARAYSELEPVVEKYRERATKASALEAAREMVDEATGDAELAKLAREEVEALTARLAEIDEELRKLLLPKDPNDGKNVILEIRSGTGGDEASLFAAELLRMYLRHAEDKRWRTRIMHESRSGKGFDVFSVI